MANAWSTASLAPWPPPGITPLTLSTTSGLSPGRRPESRCRGSPQCGFGEGSADRRSVPAAFARGAGRIVPARGRRLLAFDRGCARRGYRLSDQVIPLFAEFKHSSLHHAQRCCDGARDAGGYDRECRRSPGGRGQGSMFWRCRPQPRARDETKFADYFAAHPRARPVGPPTMPVVVEPLRYTGQSEIAADIANFKAALDGVNVAEAFLPANSPGTIEHWLLNEYYKSDEEFLFAIADVMHEEYWAIVDAGLLLQIDDPDLPDGWNCLPRITLPEYRNYAALRVDALNHALAGIPKEQVRLHVCWGSHHGPHHDDVPLKDMIDLIFLVQAGSFSIEASNPCHEHEWRVFEEAKLPEGATLVPGVVGH